MLKYVRDVIKVKESQAIHCPLAPVGVREGSRADESFIVGLLVDKFCYHNLCTANISAYRIVVFT